jgi:hypothetical protein
MLPEGSSTNTILFADLPEALVEEMLSNYRALGKQLTASLEQVESLKTTMREGLKSRHLLASDSSIILSPAHPTATCAVDGAYAIDRLISTDIATIAGVAVEGLTPPTTQTRHWQNPRHRCSVLTVQHHESTFIVAGAIMLVMELELAVKAPHDVVLLDGSLLTPLIRFNQAITKLPDVPHELGKLFSERIAGALHDYREILAARRTDRVFAAVPKYTSRREIASMLNLKNYEDRALLSMVLESGEVVGPINLLLPGESPNFIEPDKSTAVIGTEILSLIREVNVIYYRPSEYFPALRIETPAAIAKNKSRLSVLLDAIRHQCNAPGLMEPYPLYMADRMVRHLGCMLSVLRRTVTQEMVATNAITTNASRDAVERKISQAMHANSSEQGS